MKQKLQIAGIATFGLALACGIGISFGLDANATTCSTYSAAGFTCASEANVSATIDSTLTASFAHAASGGTVQGNNIAITLTPGSTDLNTTASTTATVSTNDLAGYTLSVADADSNTAMVNGANASYTIPTNAGIDNAGQVGWAVRVSNCGSLAGKSCPSGWQAMVPTGSALTLASVSGSNTTTTNDATTIQYGIRADANQASGTYSDTIVYTVTVNE